MNYMCLLLSFMSFLTYGQFSDSEILDYNYASAVINDDGSFFFNRTDEMRGYEIPKGTGLSTIFVSSIIIGAMDDVGLPHISVGSTDKAHVYSQFQSGPVAFPTDYSSSNYQAKYQKSVWKISEDEINYHINHWQDFGYEPSPSILNWPGNGDVSMGIADRLAPYIDVNNDGVYTPLEGDYPEIRGHDAVYVIINDDKLNSVNKLKIEVHLMFYQYHTGNYLSNTTFLYTQVFNRSTKDYHNFRESIYFDFDIGFSEDDLFGCDSSSNLAYIYNGDNFDESDAGTLGYGTIPPCQGITSLSHDVYATGYYLNGETYPYNNEESHFDSTLWNHMNARWNDTLPWTYGGNGLDSTLSNPSTNFIYNGNPYANTGWTEMNVFNGLGNASGDRRGMITIAENEFPADASVCADFAYIYDRSSTHLRNVQNVINIAEAIQRLYSIQVDQPCNSANYIGLEETDKTAVKISPNPTTSLTQITFHNSARRRIKVMDAAGKLFDSFEINSNSCVLNFNDKTGVFFISIESEKGVDVERIVVE